MVAPGRPYGRTMPERLLLAGLVTNERIREQRQKAGTGCMGVRLQRKVRRDEPIHIGSSGRAVNDSKFAERLERVFVLCERYRNERGDNEVYYARTTNVKTNERERASRMSENSASEGRRPQRVNYMVGRNDARCWATELPSGHKPQKTNPYEQNKNEQAARDVFGCNESLAQQPAETQGLQRPNEYGAVGGPNEWSNLVGRL